MNGQLSDIAITGVTGFVGSHVARLIAQDKLGQRLLARTPSNAPEIPGAKVFQSSYADRAAAVQALSGVRVLFMVSATESADRLEQHRLFIDAAVHAGVQHIVYTSFVSAGPEATFTLARDHYATEEYIRAAGVSFTFLRDNFYADSMLAMVGSDGVIRGPAGTGQCAIVARVDVARVAAAVVQNPTAHACRTYDITGPEALTFAQIAMVLSRVQGRVITFHDETVAEAYESRKQWAAPAWQYDAWVSTYTAIAAGEMANVSPAVEDITGFAPLKLEEFLRSGV